MPKMTFDIEPDKHLKLKELTGAYAMPQGKILDCLIEAEWRALRARPRLTRGGLLEDLTPPELDQVDDTTL